MDAARFAAEAGIPEAEAERILAEAAKEKERIDKLHSNENMELTEQGTKIMSIKAKCGTQVRELSFPIPSEMLDWLAEIKLPTTENENDPMRFCVEGSRKIQLSITLMDLQRKF